MDPLAALEGARRAASKAAAAHQRAVAARDARTAAIVAAYQAGASMPSITSATGLPRQVVHKTLSAANVLGQREDEAT